MGGPGSGREKEGVTSGDLLMTDEEFKDNVNIKAVQDYNTVVAEMMDIIRGIVEEEVWDSKGAKFVKRKPSFDSKIKAAKVWKELTLDKVVADKKSALENPGQGQLFDFGKLVKDVETVMDELKTKQVKRIGDGHE